MKILKGTAIYTGGGFYTVIGKLDNGLFFCGCTDWAAVFDTDTRTEDENGGLCCFDADWCELHEVNADIKEIYQAFEDFCKRLDENEKDITAGFEKFSNYQTGEVCGMIDFSYFDDLNR